MPETFAPSTTPEPANPEPATPEPTAPEPTAPVDGGGLGRAALGGPPPGRSRRPTPGRTLPAMLGRGVRLSTRSVDALLTALLLPVMIMLLFVYLFGGAIDVGTDRYVSYVVPGVLLLCTGFVSGQTAITVSQDMTGGIVDRFRSMDVGGASLLAGHVLASVVRNLAASILVLVVALLIGFSPNASPVEWPAAAGVLLMFAVAVSWLSAAVGLLARSPEGAGGITFLLAFLPYPSSAFVPVETMPWFLQGFARHQPATSVVETLRGLLLGTPVGDAPWLAVTWCAGITLVSVVLAALLFRRRTS